MAVLLSYHKLVERDAKNIDVQWKATSIILLVFAVICSFGVSFSLQKIITAYDNRCVLAAEVAFINSNDSSTNAFYYYGTSRFQDRINRQETSERLASQPVTITKKFVLLSDFFNESYAQTLLDDYQTQEFPIEQVQFLVNKDIDDSRTVWGEPASCDFGVYIPICQSCFGIIMTTMFIICGKGGKTEPNSFLPQPWRIVTPAIIFFLVMTILSIVNLVIVERGMNQFCESLNKKATDIGCDVALNRFMASSIEELTLAPSVYYKLLTSFNYSSFGIWILSLLVLLARIIFVVDFQLVRVTVKTIEYEKGDESTKFEAVQIEDNESSSSQSNAYKKMFQDETEEIARTRGNLKEA